MKYHYPRVVLAVSLILTALYYLQIFTFLSPLAVYGVDGTHHTSKWITGTEMRTPRSEVAGVLLNENIYIIGGFTMDSKNNDPSKTDTVEIYHTKNDSWTYADPLPLSLDHVAADSYNGKLYVVGGSTGSENIKTNKLFIYDPTTNEWREGKPMPTARSALTANFIDGILYAIGGQDSFNLPVATNEAYDPITNNWTTRTSMPVATHHAASVVVDGELYVIGGRITERSTVSFLNVDNNQKYDPKTNTWSQLKPMLSKRSGISAAPVDGNIYVFGGQDSIRVYDNNEKYNPTSDEWTLLSPMPTPRHGLASVSENIKNDIHVIGGGTKSTDSVSASHEIFRPDK